MKLPSWFRRRPAVASVADGLPQVRPRHDPDREEHDVGLVDPPGTDRCDTSPCKEEHIVYFGTATWKALSDAPKVRQ